MIKKKMVVSFAAVIILGVISGPVFADVAVSFMETSAEAWPAAGSNHGWQFTVNEPITVTHLGLFDEWPNGFEIEHPIGLWRLSDSALLASGTMSAGTGDTLIDHFRYIDVPDVTLEIGMDYVIGYYSDSDFADKMICLADDLQVDPAIKLVVGRWGDAVWQFQMPANIYEGDPYSGEPYAPHFFGPNFQFIPEPASAVLMIVGATILGVGRRKR